MEDQYDFAVDKQYGEWCIGGPWFNEKICQSLHGPLCEELFVTVRQYIYDLMCGLYACGKRNYNSTNAIDFHGGWPMT